MTGDVWQQWGRAVVAAAAAGGVVLASALTDGRVDPSEGVQIAIQTVSAVAVWLTPNLPHSAGIKTAMAGLLAMLNVAATLILGGLSGAEAVNIVLAGVGVLAVAVAPSKSRGEDPPPREPRPRLRVPPEAVPPHL